MNPSLEAVLEGFQMIWAPGAEAMRVQQALGVRSFTDMSAALEQAGYEVCYVDLPDTVSGFPMVIDGKPLIVLNRAKSARHLQYTVPHELAHHVLHLDASGHRELPSEGAAEFEAHQFAAAWILLLANDQEWKELVVQNPESVVIIVSLLMTAGIVLTALIAHLWSSLCRARTLRPVTNN